MVSVSRVEGSGRLRPRSASLCSRPPRDLPASSALVFMAFLAAEPVARLSLMRHSEYCVYVRDLRVINCLEQDESEVVVVEMLRHVSRNVAELRVGGALLARASSIDATKLTRLGFATSGLADVYAFARRRDARESFGASHAAIHVYDIEKCIDFFSLLEYRTTSTFLSSGARCAWLSVPWSSLALELIEVPRVLQTKGVAPTSDPSSVGIKHLCVDVTPRCSYLHGFLEDLQRRSEEQFGRRLRVLTAPHQQMMGSLVAEVALIRAPDGVEIELLRRAAELTHEMLPDWEVQTAEE